MRCIFFVRMSLALTLFVSGRSNAMQQSLPSALGSRLNGCLKSLLVSLARFAPCREHSIISCAPTLAAVAVAVIMAVLAVRMRHKNRQLQGTVVQLKRDLVRRDQLIDEALQKLQEFDDYATELEERNDLLEGFALRMSQVAEKNNGPNANLTQRMTGSDGLGMSTF